MVTSGQPRFCLEEEGCFNQRLKFCCLKSVLIGWHVEQTVGATQPVAGGQWSIEDEAADRFL